MKIRKIFNHNRKNNIDNYETIKNVPKVIFKDLMLQIEVGKWLEIIPISPCYNYDIKNLNDKKIIKKYNISNEKLKKIEESFEYILKLTGIDTNEICTLDNFNQERFTFNCHFNNSNTNADITLTNEDLMDTIAKITINYPKEGKTYRYVKEEKKEPLQLINYKTINNENNYTRYLSSYGAYITLEDKEYKLSLDINKPKTNDLEVNNDTYKLKNEAKLQQYLLNISFPIKIDEIYKKICEISLENIKNYPKISIEVKRKEIDNSDKITDNILIRNGILKKFTMTKNKKTVTIDKDGNWSYESPKLFINQTKNGNINYNLNDISKEEISNMDSLSEQYNIINEEVKKVKKLTKDIINN